MSASDQLWTDSAFAPGASLYGETQEAAKELTPYRVHLGDETYDQSEFTNDTEHRYQLFSGGVGSGKTIGGLIRMAAHVAEWNPGHMGAIVTPTSYGIKNAILPKLQRWGFLDHWDYHGPQSEAPGLHTPNGTRILLESANNQRKIERLRGYDLAWFWLDEAAYIPEEAWSVLTSRLRVGNYPNGFATTTPKGYNWVWDTFLGDEALPSTHAVRGVPSFANPHTPVEYRRDILGDFSGQHRQQEVLGQFVTFEGLVYPWFSTDDAVEAEIGYTSTPDDAGHVVHDVPDIPVESVFYGVDWGFYPHPAAIIAFAKLRNGEIYALEEHVETRNTPEDLADVIIGTKTEKGMYDRYGQGPVYCDPSEPSNIEDFQRRGIQAQKADNSVDPGIGYVTSIRDKLRVYHTCQTLINELNQYRYKDGGDEPVKKNDHASDATRYALFTHSQNDVGNVGVAFGD